MYSDTDLSAYLDEALPPEQMAVIESALRGNSALLARLSGIGQRRDAGQHTLGDIWRRHRLSCPSREELGSYLLGAMSDEAAAYVKFHIETVGCRVCQANLEDLRAQQSEADRTSDTRRRKYFQSSAGYFKRK
jgi:anti-sigma factor RsiW